MSERVMPKAGVTEFEVSCNGVKQFRRADILFTSDEPKRVPADKLTTEQQIELLNTHTLTVKQIVGGKAGNGGKATPMPPADGKGDGAAK